MGYAWLEEAGLIRGTPEWEEREAARRMEEQTAWTDETGRIHRGLPERRRHV